MVKVSVIIITYSRANILGAAINPVPTLVRALK